MAGSRLDAKVVPADLTEDDAAGWSGPWVPAKCDDAPTSTAVHVAHTSLSVASQRDLLNRDRVRRLSNHRRAAGGSGVIAGIVSGRAGGAPSPRQLRRSEASTSSAAGWRPSFQDDRARLVADDDGDWAWDCALECGCCGVGNSCSCCCPAGCQKRTRLPAAAGQRRGSVTQNLNFGKSAGDRDDSSAEYATECALCVDGAACGSAGTCGPYGPMGPLVRASLWLWRAIKAVLLLLLGHCLVRVGKDTLWVFHPDRKWRWDVFVLILTLYTAMETPFVQAFSPDWPWINGVSWTIDALFFLDLLVNTRTAFWDDGHKLEIRASRILWRYMVTWMAVDLVSSVPLELLGQLVLGPNDSAFELRIISGLKSIRLVRLHRLTSVLARLQTSSIFGIVRLYGAILLIGHWLACAWYALAISQLPSGVGETWALNAGINGYIMLTSHDVEGERRAIPSPSPGATSSGSQLYVQPVLPSGPATTTQHVGRSQALPLSPLVRAAAPSDLAYNYVTCLVEVVMALFRTQRFRSTTVAENVFLLGLVLLGAALQAIVFGQVAFLVSKFNSHRSEFDRQISDVRERMRYHKLPGSLIERVTDYYQRQFDTHRLGVGASDPVAWVKHIGNEPLSSELLLFVHRDLITKVDIFRGASAEVILKIVRSLKAALFLPGDYVVKMGDVGDSMFFIRSGECKVLLPASQDSTEFGDEVIDGMRTAKVLSTGAAFGELALLFSTERTATVISTTYSDLSALSAADFDRILDENMEFGMLLMANFQHYIQRDYEDGAVVPTDPPLLADSEQGGDEQGASGGPSRTPFSSVHRHPGGPAATAAAAAAAAGESEGGSGEDWAGLSSTSRRESGVSRSVSRGQTRPPSETSSHRVTGPSTGTAAGHLSPASPASGSSDSSRLRPEMREARAQYKQSR
ncbi:hypothetical protein FNF28_00265 [Cafeteria roenbergensis]|uniref:Cyclic nucleotide-binding domain-containing protein n=1 Tax=Cafeteria roenbergensis TaxID=33653 RepID=A0A5A8E3C6_CAFRO|nr:hypothetical protein FNF28_00265 [Cafeteria roenbergensis]